MAVKNACLVKLLSPRCCLYFHRSADGQFLVHRNVARRYADYVLFTGFAMRQKLILRLEAVSDI